MSSPEQHHDFPLVMRGYDRPQVDEFVAALEMRLADATRESEDLRERLHAAEEHTGRETPALDAVGERVASILRAATEAAEAIRTEARDEARALLAEAGRTRVELETELTDLTRRRDEVMAELTRVREVVDGVLGPTVDLREPLPAHPEPETMAIAGGKVRRVV
jgi:DivIVA domain-containing protein